MQAYIYKQKGEDLEQIEKLLDYPSKTYIASSRDCSIYQQLKRDLEQAPGLLIISSIAAIGSNKYEVFDELLWLHDKHIATVIADLPATWIFNDPSASDLALRVILDVYKSLLDNKSFEIHPVAAAATGRRKIAFPKNWEQLYNTWNTGKITSKEFIEQSGLRKGTFYHLLLEYRELIKNKGGYQ